MIRAFQVHPGTAAWNAPRPPGPSARSATQDPTTWFDHAEPVNLCIGGEVSPEARGLTVDQHAARVLMHLFGEREAG